jgi:hypothetical protein
VLRTSDQLESAAKAEKDRQERPYLQPAQQQAGRFKPHFPLPGARVLDPPIQTSWRGF